MHVAITGAAGAIGEVVRDAFPAESRTLFTHNEREGVDSELLDVTDRAAFEAAIADCDADVLLHLAWIGAPREGWKEGTADNLQAAVNAYEIARDEGIDRIVFPSSVHAVGMYNRENPHEAESRQPDPQTVVSPLDPPRPDSYYGVAKVACEGLGQYYADRYGLESVLPRVGWVMDREELTDTREEGPGVHRFARSNWLSHRDCRDLFAAAVSADLPMPAVVCNGISENADRYLTLAPTMRALGYRPRDDASDVLGDDGDGDGGSEGGGEERDGATFLDGE